MEQPGPSKQQAEINMEFTYPDQFKEILNLAMILDWDWNWNYHE